MTEVIQEDDLLPYRVGGLLYVPATKEGMAERLRNRVFPDLSSMAFCLEDAIMDSVVTDAEARLLQTLGGLEDSEASSLPLLFVRVRSPRHLAHVREVLGELEALLTGYVFPKFDTCNAEAYLDALVDTSAGRARLLYAMPILESASIARVETRIDSLQRLREIIGPYRDRVLNIRVGGNDLCSHFGIRRNVNQTIYDVGVVRDALIDIQGIFGRDYVISGPVWEYYGQPGGAWEAGLREELSLDFLNGFVGKTAIHPCQLPAIRQTLVVSKADYEDARAIADWAPSNEGVASGYGHQRMNELKCHSAWARKTLRLARVYGVADDE